MKFDVKPHSLNTIVNDAVLDAKGLITQNENRIALNLLEGDDEVEIDDNRLAQVLDAILRNAAENTHDGDITVTCEANGEGADRIFKVIVADTGCGIEESRLNSIFETLIDKRDASSARYGGTGLNLSVTYRLAKTMGCDISVESMIDEGSTFTVTIPAASKMIVPQGNEAATAEAGSVVGSLPGALPGNAQPA